jgi:hypothetical protein
VVAERGTCTAESNDLLRYLARRHLTPDPAAVESICTNAHDVLLEVATSHQGLAIQRLRAIHLLQYFAEQKSTTLLAELVAATKARAVIRRTALRSLEQLAMRVESSKDSALRLHAQQHLQESAMLAINDVDMHVRLSAIDILAEQPLLEPVLVERLQKEDSPVVRSRIESALVGGVR